jgi:hypothetical protein
VHHLYRASLGPPETALDGGFVLPAALAVFSHGPVLQTNIGKAVYRDRTRSVPDKMLGTHGDAAFAEYVWLLSYSYRLPGRNHPEQ